MLTKRVGLGAAGDFRCAMHTVAVVAGYRKALVGNEQAMSSCLYTRKYSTYLSLSCTVQWRVFA